MIDDEKKKKADEERLFKAIGPTDKELEKGEEIEGWLKEDSKSADLSSFRHKQNVKDTKSLLEEVDEIDRNYDLSEYEKLSLKMLSQNMTNQNDLYESIQSANAVSEMSLGQKLVYLREHNPVNAISRLGRNTEELLKEKAYSAGKWYGILKGVFGLFSKKISKWEAKTRNKDGLSDKAQNAVARTLLNIFGGDFEESLTATIYDKKDASKSLEQARKLHESNEKLKNEHKALFENLFGIDTKNFTISDYIKKGLIKKDDYNGITLNEEAIKGNIDKWRKNLENNSSYQKKTRGRTVVDNTKINNTIENTKKKALDYLNKLDEQESAESDYYANWGLASFIDEKTQKYIDSNPNDWHKKLHEDLGTSVIKTDEEFLELANKDNRTDEENEKLLDYLARITSIGTDKSFRTSSKAYSYLNTSPKQAMDYLNSITAGGIINVVNEGDKISYISNENIINEITEGTTTDEETASDNGNGNKKETETATSATATSETPSSSAKESSTKSATFKGINNWSALFDNANTEKDNIVTYQSLFNNKNTEIVAFNMPMFVPGDNKIIPIIPDTTRTDMLSEKDITQKRMGR